MTEPLGIVASRSQNQWIHSPHITHTFDHKANMYSKLVAPRLYLIKGESENLQLSLSTTISSSISLEIINLAAEYIYFFIQPSHNTSELINKLLYQTDFTLYFTTKHTSQKCHRRHISKYTSSVSSTCLTINTL
jgi:hypothetical protein